MDNQFGLLGILIFRLFRLYLCPPSMPVKVTITTTLSLCNELGCILDLLVCGGSSKKDSGFKSQKRMMRINMNYKNIYLIKSIYRIDLEYKKDMNDIYFNIMMRLFAVIFRGYSIERIDLERINNFLDGCLDMLV